MSGIIGEAVLWIFFRIPVLLALAVGIFFFINALIGGMAACPPRASC